MDEKEACEMTSDDSSPSESSFNLATSTPQREITTAGDEHLADFIKHQLKVQLSSSEMTAEGKSFVESSS